jgi:hypothetical protein
MSLWSGAGERSAVTLGAVSRWQCNGLRQGRGCDAEQGDALLGGNHHVPG